MNKLKNPFIKIFLEYDLNSLLQDLAEQKGSPLTSLEKICICGLLSKLTPTQISEKTNYSAKSLQVELSRTIYPLISRLTGEEKIKYQDVSVLLEGYKHPKLEILDQNTLITLSQNKSTSNQLKVTYIISTIKEGQKTQKELSDSDGLLMFELVKEGQCLTIKDPYGAIKVFLKALKMHPFQMAAIVNIIQSYDRMGQYYNSFAMCDLVLSTLRDDLKLTLIKLSAEEKDKEKNRFYMQIYTYLGNTMFDLAKESKNCSYITNSHDFYNKALSYSPYSAMVSSNMVDLRLMAIRNSFYSKIETHNQFNVAKKAMECLLIVAVDPASDFKQYKDKIVNDAILYCDGLDDWWQNALKSLKLPI